MPVQSTWVVLCHTWVLSTDGLSFNLLLNECDSLEEGEKEVFLQRRNWKTERTGGNGDSGVIGIRSQARLIEMHRDSECVSMMGHATQDVSFPPRENKKRVMCVCGKENISQTRSSQCRSWWRDTNRRLNDTKREISLRHFPCLNCRYICFPWPDVSTHTHTVH